MNSTVERIRKLRERVKYAKLDTPEEAEIAARMADELEAKLTVEEKEELFVNESTGNVAFDSYSPVVDFHGVVYAPRVWTVTPTGTVYTSDNPIPSTGFAERLRRRSPFG